MTAKTKTSFNINIHKDGRIVTTFSGCDGPGDLRRIAEGLLSQAEFLEEMGREREDDDGLSLDAVSLPPARKPNRMVNDPVRATLWAARELAAPIARSDCWSLNEAERVLHSLSDLYPRIVEALDEPA